MRQKPLGMRIFHTFAYLDPPNILWIYFLYIYWSNVLSPPKCENKLAVILSALCGKINVV